MKKIFISLGLLILVMVFITLALYVISRGQAGNDQASITNVITPNPTEEFQKYINDTKVTKIYFGTLPCDNCDGIETTLSLTSEEDSLDKGSFFLVKARLGTSEPAEQTSGSWILTANENSSTTSASLIVLTSDEGLQQTYEKINDKSIVQLKENGDRIGSGEENYNLTLQ